MTNTTKTSRSFTWSVLQGLTHTRPPDHCPHCNSPRFIRYGRKGATQRYRCRHCLRTFTATTATPLARMRRRRAFLQFIADFNQAIPVRMDARRYSVAPSTVWRWRHRLLQRLIAESERQPRRIEGPVGIVLRTFLPERSTWSSRPNYMWEPHAPHSSDYHTRIAATERPPTTIIFAAKPFQLDRNVRVGDQVAIFCSTVRETITYHRLGHIMAPYLSNATRIYPHWRLIGIASPKNTNTSAERGPNAETSAGSNASADTGDTGKSFSAFFPAFSLAESYSSRVINDASLSSYPRLNMSVQPEPVQWFQVDEDDAVERGKARKAAMMAQSSFIWWMKGFRGVKLHYLGRYGEWFNRLIHQEIQEAIAQIS